MSIAPYTFLYIEALIQLVNVVLLSVFGSETDRIVEKTMAKNKIAHKYVDVKYRTKIHRTNSIDKRRNSSECAIKIELKLMRYR